MFLSLVPYIVFFDKIIAFQNVRFKHWMHKRVKIIGTFVNKKGTPQDSFRTSQQYFIDQKTVHASPSTFTFVQQH